MSAAMDRIRRETIAQYGDAPATPDEALAHVLTVYAGEPDTRLMVEATNGIYGQGARTGLTLGDLRALAAEIARARKDADDQYKEADYWRESYRLAKGLSDDEIGAITAIRDATPKPHRPPCWFPHETCVCDT